MLLVNIMIQLKELGVVDEIIWEAAAGETFRDFPVLRARIQVMHACFHREREREKGGDRQREGEICRLR